GRPEQPPAGGVALLDPLTPRWLQSFAGAWSYYVTAIVVSPDSRTLYVSNDTSHIVAFEVATGKPRRTLYGHAGCVRSLAMAPDGRRLLSGSDDAFLSRGDKRWPGAGRPGREPPPAAAAGGLGRALGGDAAGAASAGRAARAAAPDGAVTLVRRELTRVLPAPAEDQLDRMFADL